MVRSLVLVAGLAAAVAVLTGHGAWGAPATKGPAIPKDTCWTYNKIVSRSDLAHNAMDYFKEMGNRTVAFLQRAGETDLEPMRVCLSSKGTLEGSSTKLCPVLVDFQRIELKNVTGSNASLNVEQHSCAPPSRRNKGRCAERPEVFSDAHPRVEFPIGNFKNKLFVISTRCFALGD